MVIAHAAADINQGSIPVMLPFFVARHEITYAAAAGIVFILNLVSTLAQPVFGHMADRHARPWLIPVAMISIGLGISFTGIAPTYYAGMGAVMLTGLGIAMFHPEGARLMNHLGGDQKATAMSLFGIGGQLGFAVGPLLATGFLLLWGLKGICWLLVPTAMVAVLLVYNLPSLTEGYDTGRHVASAQTNGRDLWPAFTCLTVAMLSRSTIFYGLNTFLPLYWINVLHQSKAAAGTALAILLGSTMVGNFVGGRSGDRFGYRGVTIAGFVVLMCLLPILAFVDSVIVATLLLVPIGLMLSLPFGSMVVLGLGYLPNRAGFASGIIFGVGFTFGGLTTPFFGWVADHHGFRAAMAIVSALPVLCTALSLMLPKIEAKPETSRK